MSSVNSVSTTNEAASIVNRILNGLIRSAGGDAAKAALIAEFPWMGLPFVKQLMGLIVDRISQMIYVEAAHAATKLVIDIQVSGEVSGVNAAFDNLRMAEASGDPVGIAKASADLSDAYARLIHSDGSAPA